MGMKPAVPEERLPITDRKLRVFKVVQASTGGIISPVQVGVGTAGEWWFLGKRLYEDYSEEEFNAAIGPLEERIKNAQPAKEL